MSGIPISCVTSDPNHQLFFNPEREGLSALEPLDTPKEQRNYIDIGCYMRVRVEQEVFFLFRVDCESYEARDGA